VWFFVTLAPALVSLFMAGGAIAAKAEWKHARLSRRLAVTSICTAIAGLIAAAPTAAAMSYSGFPAGVSLGLLLSPLSIAVGAIGGTYLGCRSPTNAQRLPLR
jgi:glucose uptake protein GlcU